MYGFDWGLVGVFYGMIIGLCITQLTCALIIWLFDWRRIVAFSRLEGAEGDLIRAEAIY